MAEVLDTAFNKGVLPKCNGQPCKGADSDGSRSRKQPRVSRDFRDLQPALLSRADEVIE